MRLAAAALELASSAENREVIEAAIAVNRAKRPLAAHVRWLEEQIQRAAAA